MGKKLILSEKPKIAQTITRALFNEKWTKCDGYYECENYISTYAYGHLLTLKDVDDYIGRKEEWAIDSLPFIPKRYEYKVVEDSGIKKQINIIEKLIKRNDVDLIIANGDSDHEGEVIGRLIINYLLHKNNLKKDVKRLWLVEQTEHTIRKELRNLRELDEFDNYYSEGLARAACDWTIGINYTRALTLKSNDEGRKIVFPTGRVLGVIVKYIYDRHIEQDKFVPENYYNIRVEFEDFKGFETVIKDIRYKEDEKEIGLKEVENLSKSLVFVTDIKDKQETKLPKKLFSLTTLQNAVFKHYGYNAQETLSCTQKLYEKGYVTYPRTDCEYLAEEEREKVMKVLKVYSEDYQKIIFSDTSRIFNSKKVKSHSAIIPTVKKPKLEDLEVKEKQVFEIIRNRFLANFCSEPCIINERKIIIGNSYNDYTVELKGIYIVEQGFLQYEKTLEEKILPNIRKIGEDIHCTFTLNACTTKPPVNVNLKELNNFLLNPFKKDTDTQEEEYRNILSGLQIGTPATRPGIIEKARKEGYIKEVKGIYSILPKGIYYIETSKELGIILNTEQAAILGKYLNDVFNGKISKEQCIAVIQKEVSKKILSAKDIKVATYSEQKEVIGICPNCKKNVYEGANSYYCEEYKKSCDFIIYKKDRFMQYRGKTVTPSIAKQLIKNGKANVNGLTSSEGKKYNATIKLSKNGMYYNIGFLPKEEGGGIRSNIIGKCPRPGCGCDIVESSKGYYCLGYKNINKCNFNIWKSDFDLRSRGITLTPIDAKLLITNKEVVKRNIKKKNGTGTYNLKISLKDDGNKVELVRELIR